MKNSNTVRVTRMLVALFGLLLAPMSAANPRVVANAFSTFEIPCPNGSAPTGCYEAKSACRPAANANVKLPAPNDKWFANQAGLAAHNLCIANKRHCPATQMVERCCATQCVALVKLSAGSDVITRCLQGCVALE